MRTEYILAQCKEDQYPQSNQGSSCCVQSVERKKSFRLGEYNHVSVKDLERLSNKEKEQSASHVPKRPFQAQLHSVDSCKIHIKCIVELAKEQDNL